MRGVLGVVCVVALALAAWAQSGHYPLVSHADLPLYPGLARALNLTGTVEIQLVIAKGIVADAQVKSVAIDCRNCASLVTRARKRSASIFRFHLSLTSKTGALNPGSARLLL